MKSKRNSSAELTALCVLSASGLLLSLMGIYVVGIDAAWIAILLSGVPFTVETIRSMAEQKRLRSGFLVPVTMVLAIVLGEYFAAGMVAFIMLVAHRVELMTERHAHEGVARLTSLTPQTAHVLRGGKTVDIPIEEITVGDTLSVLAGETIPVDGVILEGQTSVDQSVMTGESMPVDKKEGDAVISGTLNQFAVFTMRAEHVGQDSAMQRMVQLAEQIDAEKAPIIGQADRWATWLSIAALVVAVAVYAITGDPSRAVTVLVVFCPCAFTMATPTAILAGMANASKYGIIIRSGDALERLSHVTKAAFDKTGTLTYGKPELIDVRCEGAYSREQLIALAASAEQSSEHPLGKALLRHAQEKNIPLSDCTDFVVSAGLGVSATVDGHAVRLGKPELMEGVDIPDAARRESDAFGTEKGASCIFVLVDGTYAGFLVFADTLRVHARQMIIRLKELHVHSVLLTGDRASTANTIAGQLTIPEVYADLLPEDKMNRLAQLETGKDHVCMVGDSVNDSLALKSAYVSMAMGGIGSDIATNSADIVLVDDEVRKVSYLFQLSQKVMKKIKSNVFITMSINFWFILLAAFGLLSAAEGSIVHIISALFVVLNSSALSTAWGLD